MLRRQLFRLAVVTAFVAAIGTAPGPALALDATAFINATGNRALNALSGAATRAQREDAFRSILNDSFDIQSIGKFVLGRYWRIATKDERVEYIDLFREFIVQAYANRFSDISGTKFSVTRVEPINQRDKMVMTEVRVKGGNPVRINWRVRGSEPNYRIVDVAVEGVSMSVTQRDEFAAVIRSSGGKVSGLIRALKKKTGK